MARRRLASMVLFVVVLGATLPVGAADDDTFKHENKPENLKALFERIHKTIHVNKDAKKGAALFTSLLPDEARLKQGLKDNVPGPTLRAIVADHKKLGKLGAAEAARLASAKQTVVKVHAATTEDLAKYEKGGTAYTRFPSGAQRMAKDVLRPKVKFYEVEFLEPGKERGMKYHLFYWDGKQWSMMGPLWRAVK